MQAGAGDVGDNAKDESPGDPIPATVEVDVADSIALDARNLKLSKQERARLRESLRSGIQDLREKEIIERLKASDPLLG